jgi:hypothetical protein
MAGIVILMFLIVLAARSWGSDHGEWSPAARLRFWKGIQLVVLLGVFGAAEPVGKALVAPMFILFFAPSFVLANIVVPVGLPRVAYWTARCCGPVKLLKETSAGAAVYGALALARRRPSSTEMIAWVEDKVNLARSPRGPGVVAAGLLAALRGDRCRARGLLLIADALPRKFVSRSVRAVARDWLVADAARIGNWGEVARLGRRGRGSLRWSYALARIGERLAGDPQSCRDWQLWLWWMMAPRRLATFALLRRALAVPRDAKPAAAEPPAAASLPDALAGLAHALENRFIHDYESFARSANGVDAALDRPTTRALVQQRLQALGARPEVDAVISGLRTRVSDLLVPLLEESPRLAAGKARGPILDQATERVRARLLRDIEAQCKDCSDRQKRERSLNELGEWGAWAVMRDQSDRLLQLSPESESVLFHTMYIPVCNFAVFQHNKCRRIGLAYDVHSWLHRHSGSDPAATQLLAGNMRSGEA